MSSPFLGPLLLALLLGCGTPPEPPFSPPSDPPALGWDYSPSGSRPAYTGEFGWGFKLHHIPVTQAPMRFRLVGPGELYASNDERIDTTKEYNWWGFAGYYRPPLQASGIPAEGLTVKVGYEVLSPFSKRWERSPDGEIKVLPKTTPMDFYYIGRTADERPTEGTVRTGQSLLMGVSTLPAPVQSLNTRVEVLPPPGYTGSLPSIATGTVHWGPDVWTFTFTAPSGLTARTDFTVRTTIDDPWAGGPVSRDFTVHVMPE